MAQQKKPRLTKEDLDARFTAQQEKNRARRETKVTPEDIRRRLDERRERRAAKAVPGQFPRYVSLGLGVAMLIGSGAIAMSTSASTQSFEQATRTNEQRIAAAEGELTAIPAADKKATTKYAATLDAQITAATKKGEEVAALQQDFTTILFRGNTEKSGNGAPSTAFLDSVQHRKLLAPYFVKRSLPVTDANAYAPGSVLPFKDGQIDPRFPWHVSYTPDSQGRTVANPSLSSWQLESLVATATPGVLEATWLNKTVSSGDLLAWATASYYIDPGAFGSLIVGQTTLGARGAPSINKAGN